MHVVVGLVGIFLEAFRLFLHAFLDLEYSGRFGLILQGEFRDFGWFSFFLKEFNNLPDLLRVKFAEKII